MAATPASTSIVERRAADVAVLGSSCIALAAAYSLARRGKKVVLLPDMGLSAPRPTPEPHRPLQLTHPDAAMVSLVAEAAEYWRGLQAQTSGSGVRVLRDCRSLDLGLVRGGGQAGKLLGSMQDACKAAGVRLGSLRAEELGALFPALKLAGGVSGLLQPEGGVLSVGAANSLLTSQCERQGVLVRDRLILRGWRDAGGHFVLRASSSVLPNVLSIFEAEQLLVAPEEWPQHVLRMFGADAALQVVQSSSLQCAATAETSSLPLWRSIGPIAAAGLAPGARGDDGQLLEAAAGQVVLGFPARLAAPGSGNAAMKLALGVLPPTGSPGAAISDPWSWRADAADRLALTAAHQMAGRMLRGVGPVLLPASEPAAPGRPQAAPWGNVALHTATPDGWPALGFLPGLEAGRLLFVAAASCSLGAEQPQQQVTSGPNASSRATQPQAVAQSRSTYTRDSADGGTSQAAGIASTTAGADGALSTTDSAAAASAELLQLGGRQLLFDGYQLSPLLAKVAVDLLCGVSRPQEVELEKVDLNRKGMEACARPDRQLDTWDGLARWQSGEAFRAGGGDEEEARDRAEALAKGAKMLGADAGGEADRNREARERSSGYGSRVFL